MTIKSPTGDQSNFQQQVSQARLQSSIKQSTSLAGQVGTMAKGQKATVGQVEDKPIPTSPQMPDPKSSKGMDQRSVDVVSSGTPDTVQNESNLPKSMPEMAVDSALQMRSESQSISIEESEGPLLERDVSDSLAGPLFEEESEPLQRSQAIEISQSGSQASFNFDKLQGLNSKELKEFIDEAETEKTDAKKQIKARQQEIQEEEPELDKDISALIQKLEEDGRIFLKISKERGDRDVSGILQKINKEIETIKADLEKDLGPVEKRNIFSTRSKNLRQIANKKLTALEKCAKGLEESKHWISINEKKKEIGALKYKISLFDEKIDKADIALFEITNLEGLTTKSQVELKKLSDELDDVEDEFKNACKEGYVGNVYVHNKEFYTGKINHFERQIKDCESRMKLYDDEKLKEQIPKADYDATVQEMQNELQTLKASKSEYQTKLAELQSTHRTQQTILTKKNKIIKDLSNKMRSIRNEALLASTLTSEYLTASDPSAPLDASNRFDKIGKIRSLLAKKFQVVLGYSGLTQPSDRIFQKVNYRESTPSLSTPEASHKLHMRVRREGSESYSQEVSHSIIESSGIGVIDAGSGETGAYIKGDDVSLDLSTKGELYQGGSDIIICSRLVKQAYDTFKDQAQRKKLQSEIQALKESSVSLLREQQDVNTQLSSEIFTLQERIQNGEPLEGRFVDLIHSFELKKMMKDGPSKEELENISNFLENYALSGIEDQDPLIQSILSKIIKIAALSEQRFVNYQTIDFKTLILKGDLHKANIDKVIELGVFLGTATQLGSAVGKQVIKHLGSKSALLGLGMNAFAGGGIVGLCSLVSAGSGLINYHKTNKLLSQEARKLEGDIKDLEESQKNIKIELESLEEKSKKEGLSIDEQNRKEELTAESHRKSIILSAKIEKKKFISTHEKFMNRAAGGMHLLNGLGSMASLAGVGLGITKAGGFAAAAAITSTAVAATGWGAVAFAGAAIVVGGVIVGYKIKEQHEQKGIDEKTKVLGKAEEEFRQTVKGIANSKTHLNDEVYRDFQTRLDKPSKELEHSQGELEKEVYNYQMEQMSRSQTKRKIAGDIKKLTTPAALRALIKDVNPDYSETQLKLKPGEKNEEYVNRLQTTALSLVSEYVVKEVKL